MCVGGLCLNRLMLKCVCRIKTDDGRGWQGRRGGASACFELKSQNLVITSGRSVTPDQTGKYEAILEMIYDTQSFLTSQVSKRSTN